MREEQSQSIGRWGTPLAILLLAVLVVAPLAMILAYAVHPGHRFDWLAPLMVIADAHLKGVVFNTILLGLLVTAGATVIALPVAFLTSRTDLARHTWLDVLFIIPFMTPPYIGSMGWILFMERRGYLDQLVPAAGVASDRFFSLGGMVLIMSLQLFPFLYLVLRNSLEEVSGSLDEAAAVHGASVSYRFRRVTIPLLVSSYAMGALLVFAKTISEFGTPATFGRSIGFFVMTSEIHRYTSTWPVQFDKATSLAVVLLGTSLLFWYLQSVVSRRFSYKLLGGKGTQHSRIRLNAWQRCGAWLLLAAIVVVSIGVPYFSIIAASTMKLLGDGLSLGNFTLAHYGQVFHFGSSGLQALLNSLLLSLGAATLSAVVGTYLALTVNRSRRWSQRATDALSLLPNTVPAIVVALGLILFWNAPWMPLPLYDTAGMVVLAYAVLFLPYTVQYVKARYTGIDGALIQAGQVFGGRGIYILRRIVVPLILPGVLAGWMMTFTISIRELVASLMVLPPSMQTSATYIYSEFEQGSISHGMAMAVVSVSLTTLVLVIMRRFRTEGT